MLASYCGRMPSLQHAVVSRVIPILRRNMSAGDVPAMRAALREANRSAREVPPKDVRRTHDETVSTAHGFPVFTLSRPGAGKAGPTVLYLHGGAYVRPADARHWRFATRLAGALDTRAVLPLYPLAPEFTAEDSFEEMLEIFEEVATKSPQGVVLVGDSAGGGYALALAEALRDRGGAQPDRLVLIAPWVDLTGTTPGVLEAAERDPWLSHPHLAIYASMWAGTEDPAELATPRLSPGLGDLEGLPPTLMLCGTRDLLQPGCDALFSRAEAADWPMEYVVAPDLIHVYPLLPIPEAREALGQIVHFCRHG
jgi:monoterpene epsilon-lactone hydrolase